MNKIEILSVKNNIIKDYPYDESLEFQFINTKIEDGVIKNSNDVIDWNHMTKFERVLNEGVWRFRFEILNMDQANKGPVIALVNQKMSEASFDVIASKILGINTP